jgi:hypothetical protein
VGAESVCADATINDSLCFLAKMHNPHANVKIAASGQCGFFALAVVQFPRYSEVRTQNKVSGAWNERRVLLRGTHKQANRHVVATSFYEQPSNESSDYLSFAHREFSAIKRTVFSGVVIRAMH